MYIHQLRGVRPFLSDKFDIIKHKNYKLLEDYDKKNLFYVEENLNNRDKIKINRNSLIARLWINVRIKIFLVFYLYINHGGRHMRSYKSKEELENEIKKTFEKYISEFDNIPEELKDKKLEGSW